MGNSDSRENTPGRSKKESEIKSTNSIRLKEVYENACREVKKEVLEKHDFEDHIMRGAPCNSWKLYEYLCTGHCNNTEQNSDALSANDFYQNGEAILQMNDLVAQSKFHFDLFTGNKDKLTADELEEIINTSFACSCRLSGIDDQTLVDITSCAKSINKSMFGGETSIDFQRFNSLVQRHCSRLMTSLHQYTCQCFLSSNRNSKQIFSESSAPASCTAATRGSQFTENRYIITMPYAWLLSCHLSYSYFPVDSLTENLCQLNSIIDGGWTLLYNSEDQGLSVNRLQHHVFAYESSTVSFLSFEGHSFCFTCTSPWREDKNQWGGNDCFLIQLLPEYKVVLSGTNLLFMNFKSRDLPKGLQIGTDHRSRILQIDGDLHKVKLYGVEYTLHRLEVWGCGGKDHFVKQQQQRAWEKKDTQKQRDRKLKLEDWEDSPDRVILNMGGVTTAHAEQLGDKS